MTTTSTIELVLGGWAILALVFAALWLVQLRTRNATSVDVAWTASIGALGVTYALVLDGDPGRRALVAALGAGWAARLGWYLARDRLRGKPEDGRYRDLRVRWGARAPGHFFLLYQGQAAAAVLLSLPLLAAMRGAALDPWSAAGVALWAAAVAGEAAADRQLARFRADPANRGRTCRAGLWRYSRHPNYFFEWVHWWAYVLIGRGAMLTWLGPAVMLLFLFRVTGIPHAERQALASRGDDYRAYRHTTSAFFPWFPRADGGSH